LFSLPHWPDFGKFDIMEKERPDPFNKVEEQSTEYVKPSRKSITFSTLEEQERDNYLYWIGLSPEQRLEQATLLIKALYREELKKPADYSRIIFD
jgi:hypothetical protein